MATRKEILDIGGREVTITNPDKVYFPRSGHTKLDLVRYYLAVADGALVGVRDRPMALKRYVDGVEGQAFYQKRAPGNTPEWIDTVEFRYPSGGVAHELIVSHPAALAWVANLGCLDLHPHPVRADDLGHPDELRVDLDPIPGVPWSQVRQVAMVVREVLDEVGLTGWPKTSGSRGFHVFCRIERRWTFTQVRTAALALAREVERRAPDLATSRWWKEERQGVFVDYNQNAKDHTTASAYSIRPTPDARVSTPLLWDEVPDCVPERYTIDTVPARYADVGDPGSGIDDRPGSIEPLLEMAKRDKREDARRPAGRPADPLSPTGRRQSSMPLIIVARAEHEADARTALEHWKQRYPDVWPLLEPADVLVDSMRGRSSTWTRIRLNLRHVPEEQRPPQEPLEVDFDPWAGLGPPRPPGGPPGLTS
ncbi:MAG: DNA polymerase domain-containing protein [Actinobacteria bacterium]|nr:MAG: DNA polymerase domain-containing protein [Actinomycetota bacterium]